MGKVKYEYEYTRLGEVDRLFSFVRYCECAHREV